MHGPRRLSPAPLATLQADRVCLIKTSSLGDVVQSLPVLAALRRRFPRARIAWVVNTSYAPLLRPIPLLDEVIEFDRHGGLLHSLAGWRRLAGLFRELAGRDFDVAIDLQGLFRSGVLCFATRAPTRIGLRSAREGARTFYTDIADDHADGRTGAVHRYWRVAELLGIGPAPIEFPLCLTDEELDWARRMLAGLPRPVVGVCPGARWRTKRWPAGSFAESLNAVVGRAGGSVALVGGADETAVTRAVAERLMVPHIDLCGQTSLRRLPALFRHCDAVLTNDSGPMHLAAAVGARIVSIFTCTAPERAAPFGQEDRAIATTVACKASYLRECPTMHCMRELTPARVIPALAAALSSAMPAPSTSSPSFPAARIPKAA